jgi:hypothetical protein
MTALAHTTAAAPHMGTLKKALANTIQAEIKEAKRIQALTNCTWTEALKAAAGKEQAFIVTEGISGMWHYHLSKPAKFTRGLCGAQTMQTAIELADFGKSFGDHFPKKPTWCSKCKQLAAGDQHAEASAQEKD